jgi:hypothetical protein
MMDMSNLSKTAGTVLIVVLMTTACHGSRAQESRVIRLMEENGSGDLSTYTAPGLQQWFAARPDLAKRVVSMCEPIAKNSAANWAASAEGTACASARRTIAFMPAKVTADQRAW